MWNRIRDVVSIAIGILVCGPVVTYLLIQFSRLLAHVIPVVGATAAQTAWIGFYGSFSGGIIGALVALWIMRQQTRQQVEQARRALFTQLRYTHEKMREWKTYADVGQLIYDPDWNKHIAYLDFLTTEEFTTIVNWFCSMRDIEEKSARAARHTANQIIAMSNMIYDVDESDKEKVKMILDRVYAHWTPKF